MAANGVRCSRAFSARACSLRATCSCGWHSEREHAVLRFLATSLSTAEIADEMCLSVNTVKTHLAAIYRKLAASRRRDAVLRARRLELL